MHIIYALILDRRRERVLMVRNDTRGWSLPGGGHEPGESLAEAAAREASEETGHGVEVTKLVAVSERFGARHDTFFVFAARLADASAEDAPVGPVDDAEIEEVAWLPLARADREMPWYPRPVAELAERYEAAYFVGGRDSGAPDLPAPLEDALAGASFEAIGHGHSGAGVWRVVAADSEPRYLKMGRGATGDELAEEAARMRWLAGRLPVPTLLSHGCEQADDPRTWLLMSAVDGVPLSDAAFDDRPHELARLAADALRRFHRLPVEDCPFDMRLRPMIELAARRLEAGLVDESDFDARWRGESGSELYATLIYRQPPDADLVVAHGDPCLPNLLADDGRPSGFIDLSRVGVSDRHRDLALVVRSLEYNGHRDAADHFLERYGVDRDDARLEYFMLLDEFF